MVIILHHIKRTDKPYTMSETKREPKSSEQINYEYIMFRGDLRANVNRVSKEVYEEELYKFVESLPKNGFKWFRVDLGLAGNVLVKLFPCGTKWVRVTDLTFVDKRRKSIVIESVCQSCIEFGKAISQQEFEDNLLNVLDQIRLSAFNFDSPAEGIIQV